MNVVHLATSTSLFCVAICEFLLRNIMYRTVCNVKLGGQNPKKFEQFFTIVYINNFVNNTSQKLCMVKN